MKPANRKAVKLSVSLPNELLEWGQKRARSLGFESFSAYLQQLLRTDALKRGDFILVSEDPADYGTHKKGKTE
jgi:hypothetical protein